MALCDQSDVEARLQITITAEPESVVTKLIAAATGHIERIYGGSVEADDYIAEVHSPPGPLFLRHVPVNSIAAIREDGAVVDASEYQFTRYGVVERLNTNGFHFWWKGALKPGSIEVDYNAGFETVPEDIRDVCAWMVANAVRRGLAMSSDNGNTIEGVTQESLGNWAASYATSLADPSALVVMTDEQRDVIRYYRVPALA